MSDIRTLIYTGLGEVGRHQPEDEDIFTVNLMRAMEYHRSQEFWFNQSTWDWEMVAGSYEYPANVDPLTSDPPDEIHGLPWDIHIPKILQVKIGSAWRQPMDWVGIERIRSWVWDEASTSYPCHVAWYDEAIFVYPVPNSDYTARLDYVRDIDRPRYTHDGSDWVFEQRIQPPSASSGTWEALDPTYSNDWIEEVPDLITSWAKWKSFASYYRDEKAAATAWAEYQLFLSQARARTTRHEGPLNKVATPL